MFYLCTEYLAFTLRIFRSGSLLLWTEWMEFASMNIFFALFASAFCLLIFISYTCIAWAVLAVVFLFFRFQMIHRPLVFPLGRLTILRLLRFVQRNTVTMQYVFSLNRLYGPILFSFLAANLPSNALIAIYLLQNRFSAKQTIFMVVMFLGQLNAFFCVHLVAAMVSKKIHRPYKRIQALNLLIHRCPLQARFRVANAIQTFHVKSHKYGISYGTDKWTFGLITLGSFTKFVLLYG